MGQHIAYRLLLGLPVLFAVVLFGSMIDGYYSFRTFNRIASSVAIIGVVAVGQTLVVLTRNIDLSVGSIAGFTAFFLGTLIANHNGVNPLLAVAIGQTFVVIIAGIDLSLGATMGMVSVAGALCSACPCAPRRSCS